MIECAYCGYKMPDDQIYDRTPCPGCGALITAFMTDKNGKRMSQRDYLDALTHEAALDYQPSFGIF